MGKKLSEMSLEELWQLSPIVLTKHQSCWKDWYEEEAESLSKIVTQAVKISHIGSTAVSTIWAKPIIDILVEVPKESNLGIIRELLEKNGYICMAQSEERISFNKGYTEEGFAEKVFHVHLRYAGDNDELFFRNYLIEETNIAKEYEKMKLKLWKKFEHDRDGYTNAKTEFVHKYTQKAKNRYGNRCYLHIPSLDELWYRKQILSDSKTMAYNKGYQLNFKGYHNDTGCVDFPKERWERWYQSFVNAGTERFYAYVTSVENNTFIGEVNVHKSQSGNWHDMGVVIESKYRGNGYATEAIRLLIKEAFEQMQVNVIHNDFETNRKAAIKAHLSAGFQVLSEKDGVITLYITKEQFLERD